LNAQLVRLQEKVGEAHGDVRQTENVISKRERNKKK
jgi:hypothetical protein